MDEVVKRRRKTSSQERLAGLIQALLAKDGKPHTAAEISMRTGATLAQQARARQWLRDRGVYVHESRVLGEGWWEITTDADKIQTGNVRSASRAYTEHVRLWRATSGALADNPHDIALSFEQARQQDIVLALGTRCGKTVTQIATDLVVAS